MRILKFAFKRGTRIGHIIILLGDREDSVGRPALMYDSAMHPRADVIVSPSEACEYRTLSSTSTMPYVAAARYALALTWAPQVGGAGIFALANVVDDAGFSCSKGPVTLRVKSRNKVKGNATPTKQCPLCNGKTRFLVQSIRNWCATFIFNLL